MSETAKLFLLNRSTESRPMPELNAEHRTRLEEWLDCHHLRAKVGQATPKTDRAILAALACIDDLTAALKAALAAERPEPPKGG